MNQLLPAFVLSIFLSTFFHTNATTIIVQNVNDSGPGSLRTALANSQSGDIIRFNPNLLSGGNNTITLLSPLSVDKPLTISGLYNQNDTLYLNGNNTTQIMDATLLPTVTGSVITLDSLVFINGNANNLAGAVKYQDYNGSNTLIVRNCLFKNNLCAIGSTNNFGSISVRIENSVIRDCSIGVQLSSVDTVSVVMISCEVFGNVGSGIKSYGEALSKIEVEGSWFHDNHSTYLGGAIHSYSLRLSQVIVSNSTLNGNSGEQGGAVWSYVGTQSQIQQTLASFVTLTNCTITGNSTLQQVTGGSVYSFCDTGSSMDITNCTIVGNNTLGLHNWSGTTSSLTIKSSIVALNTDWDVLNYSNYNYSSNINSAGYNIFGLIAGGNVVTDQLNATPAQLNLGPLQLNGGTTKTMLPSPGSIAIDMGNSVDFSDAQNIPLTGTIRDVGAAEVCTSTFGDSTAVVCGSFNWYGTLYHTSGNYTHSLTNIGGCDSIVTLDLTVLPVFQTSQQVSSCGPYTWPLNGQTYGFSGQYTDTLQTVNGCDSIVQLNLSIHSIPTSNIIDNGDATFTAVYSGFNQWIECVTGTVVFGGSTFAPQQNGNYALVAADGVTGCSDTSACFLVDYLSIDSKDLLSLSLSPNPTNNEVQINFSGPDAELTVYDVQGKMVLKDRIQNQEIISLKNFERGVYLFDFSNSNGHSVQRVVKQ